MSNSPSNSTSNSPSNSTSNSTLVDLITGNPISDEIPVISKIKKFNSVNKLSELVSTCPWADYLACSYQDDETSMSLFKQSKIYMKRKKKKSLPDMKGGSLNNESNDLDNYNKSLDSVIKIGENILKQTQDIDKERIRAAAAISYINRLLLLGKKKELDILNEHLNPKSNSSKNSLVDTNPNPVKLDSVMYKLITYIKNTRNDI
jgi:hypothetical protein